MFMKKTAIFLLLLSLLASPFSIWAEEPSIDELSATQVEELTIFMIVLNTTVNL